MCCALGFTFQTTHLTVTFWILALETSPASWLDNPIGEHETIIGVIKAFGLVLFVILALRSGLSSDRYNSSFVFIFMFLTGPIHGLYLGLTLISGLRSLISSKGPFLFSFVGLPATLISTVITATICGPLFTVGFGTLLAILDLDDMFVFEQGTLRLGASGEPPVLSSFAMTGTNAAYNENLCIEADGGAVGLTLLLSIRVARHTRTLPRDQAWLMRIIFLGFAINAAIDKTLIASTSNVFLIWVSTVFATREQELTTRA